MKDQDLEDTHDPSEDERPIKLRVESDPAGLWVIDAGGKRTPLGVMLDGVPFLIRAWFEDEREHCDHCEGLFCVGKDMADMDPERCGRCGRTHYECLRCDRDDAEKCSDCDETYCAEHGVGHMCTEYGDAPTRCTCATWPAPHAHPQTCPLHESTDETR